MHTVKDVAKGQALHFKDSTIFIGLVWDKVGEIQTTEIAWGNARFVDVPVIVLEAIISVIYKC